MKWTGLFDNRSINILKRAWPIPASVVIASLFYWLHISHLPVDSTPFVLAPVVFLNLIFAFLLNLYFRSSVQSSRKPFGALVLSAIFCAMLYYFEFRYMSVWMGIGLVVLFLWIFFAFLLRLAGQFYVGFAGIALFSIIFLSYRALDILEIRYIISQVQEREIHVKAETRISQWIKGADGGVALLINGDPVFQMKIPDGMEFAEPLKEGDPTPEHPEFLFPAIGKELGRIHRLESKSGEPPFILILDPLFKERPEIDRVKSEVELILGYMHSRYMIQDIGYLGEKEILPPLTGSKLSGPTWSYTMKEGREVVTFAIYYPHNYEKNRLAILIVEPFVEGFPHHPDILSFLSSVRWN